VSPLWSYRVVLPAEPGSLPAVRDAVRDATRAMHMDRRVEDVVLAVSEAANNILQHAYPAGSGDRPLVLEFADVDGVLEVRVADAGSGFDPEAERAHAEPPIGMHLITTLADHVEVLSEADLGTEVVLRFRGATASGDPRAGAG
jgi:anti-sigma regulatory factor (Ser/Thr protein kinase)